MKDQRSITSLMSAFVRAYHTENSAAPVFMDRIARRLMTAEEYDAIRNHILDGAAFFEPGTVISDEADREKLLSRIIGTQLAPTPVARAAFCEECLKTEVRTGAVQYVILGAGLDTFAWREPELLKKLRVFEVDYPATQADKRKRLADAGLKVPEELTWVPMDFSRDDLRQKLTEAGFDPEKKTFFSWMGVSYYLTAEEIEKTLDSVSTFAAEGSAILFDYADEDLFGAQERRVQNMLAMAEAGGEPMKFCCGDMELTRIFEKYHFLIYELLTPQDIQERFFKGNPDGLTAFEHISYALAVLKGAPLIGTKEKILNTALRLFARDGYEAVSVSQISSELGLTKGALYRHYTGKRDIFASILNRMEQLDYDRAKQYGMPEETPRTGCPVPYAAIRRYTAAQFRYFTVEKFPSDFRRMLMLEQFRNKEMASLYQQYFVSGPEGYMAELFRSGGKSPEEAKALALEFYAPMLYLYSHYDGDGNRNTTEAMLEAHLSRFGEQYMKNESTELTRKESQ